MRHTPLLVMGALSKVQISWHMGVIGFLTQQKAFFDAPNTASVASTNTSLRARPPIVLLTKLADD